MKTTYCPHNGKQQFASQHLAARAVKRLSGGNVYRCPNCHEWHISHASLDQLRGKRMRREQSR